MKYILSFLFIFNVSTSAVAVMLNKIKKMYSKPAYLLKYDSKVFRIKSIQLGRSFGIKSYFSFL